jgi:hypothetical protein
LIHLLIGIIVIGILLWIVERAQIPQPAKWVVWAIIFIIALAIFLPMVGIRLPA